MSEQDLNVIIFSCDRAMQLQACLKSFEKNLYNNNKDKNIQISVIYKTTNEDYKKGYESLLTEFNYINFINETQSFKKTLLTLFSQNKSPLTMFLVDDIIFVSPISLQDKQFELIKNPNMLCISLRLYEGITDCYATGQTSPVPKFIKGNVWSWLNQSGDWGYPMSVDGNIFKTDTIRYFVENGSYSNPNTFEAALDGYKNNFSNLYLCCYMDVPRLINIPENRVQNLFNNRFAKGYTAEELNKEFLNNKIIDIEHYQGMKSNTVHVPAGLKLIEKR